jgi:dTDP-4-amino-4,6-dideoxygalactose transaminase
MSAQNIKFQTPVPVEIPFIDLKTQQVHLRSRIDTAIQKVLDHGSYIMGPEVNLLEKQLSLFTGVSHSISCSSGTDALLLALLALDLKETDAVFVPVFTFVATAEVVLWGKAQPVFVDVCPDTFNICPDSLVEAIDLARKNGLTPRVVIPVDLYGQPANYDRLQEISQENDLVIIEDAAQSFGATWNGKRTGHHGRIACTSFFPAKPLGCYGDGGAIFTKDSALAEVIESARIHGQGNHRYENVRLGMTGRMDSIQAAILIEKLSIFEEELLARQIVADRYDDRLKNVVRTPTVHPNAKSAWAQYTIQLENRQAVMDHLETLGIPSVVYYPLLVNEQKPYQQFLTVDTKNARQLTSRVLSLPMHPYLEADVQDYIINGVIEATS